MKPTQNGDAAAEQKSLAQQPLLLVMPVQIEALPVLKQKVAGLNVSELNEALDTVGTVHSTRFVILEDEQGKWAKLIVVAIFDGTVDAYIAAFARELRDQFNELFKAVSDHPKLPVEENVQAFIDYVKSHDVPSANGQSYRANPGLTALDIWEAMSRDTAAPDLRRLSVTHERD
jgi:hypothetical protein